jgi:DNA-binding MarR family transcriptional regulator
MLDRKKQIAQDYGISFPLNHAKIYLLYTIHRYPDENISQLALRLGITKGAIAQITKKLLEKGLITSFHTSENKKEVYFYLTGLGEKAVLGFRHHLEKQSAGLQKYLRTLTAKDIKTILAFLDTLIDENALD